MPTDAPGFAAALEERFLVPVCTSRHAQRWVTGHRALSWPLVQAGEVRYYSVPAGDETIRMATVGRPKRFEEWVSRLGARPADRADGRVSLRTPAALDGVEADLLLAHVHRWAAEPFRRAGWHTVPSAVRWAARAREVPPVRPSRSLRCDLKRVARHAYTHEVAGAAADWEEFYLGMVEPEAKARFGGEAWLPSTRLRHDLAARGSLHFVLLDGARVAGCCAVPAARGVWIPLTGVRDGDPRLLAAGAGTAATLATLRWAAQAGYERVDLGRTTPFLDDGVAFVKQKLGFEPVPEPLAHLVAIRMRRGARAAARLLREHPVRIETAAGLAILGGDDASR